VAANSLVAVGDEEGRVRLLESAKGGKPAFGKIYLAFRPHTNAIIDMAFTEDDSLLATASGDQTARVIDMFSQTTISVLAHHSASVKQVRFQPGSANNSVLATSSRDGSVQIWDLRCKSSEGPVSEVHIPLDPEHPGQVSRATYGYSVNSIYDAHQPVSISRQAQSAASNDIAGRGEVPGRIGDVSVTSMCFLPQGQEHFLLTASEANASVKLWDIRAVHNLRKKGATALSHTQLPESHSQWRHFGISSMNLGGDGSRLYTVCKDNTVYTYSTSHLVMGHVSDSSTRKPTRRRIQGEERTGLGPLYGFRHPQLHATSFYVKSALRKAKGGKSEMLAVGSSDGCAILFPTDERYLQPQRATCHAEDDVPFTALRGIRSRPALSRSSSGQSTAARLQDTVPISNSGTPLIRGHDREVGALSWTSEGELITVGDDFLVRCWREGEDARDLRLGGEQEGRRWGCGWADVAETYDDDE
jgi:WD40 repeat protein